MKPTLPRSTIQLDSRESMEIFADALTPDLRRAILTPGDGTWLYLIECERDNYFYVGISCQLANRLEKHLTGHGSDCTRLRGVKSMLPIELFDDRAAALQAETALVRQLRRAGYRCHGGGYTWMHDI